jgi:hypothetical protein
MDPMDIKSTSRIGFIIPCCIKTDIHLNQLYRCIKQIIKFHPTIPIILINDTPPSAIYNQFNDAIAKLCNSEEQSILEVVPSINLGSGELQTFKILLEHTNKFDKAIIIQDCMILLHTLDNLDCIDKVQFLWYFSNHTLQWNSILEPENEYNIKNYIQTHTDLLIDCIITDFRDNLEFQKFAINKLRYIHMNTNANAWPGCFGCCCIITKTALEKMNSIVPFIDTFIKYSNRRYRCAAETIFSLLCHFCFPEIDFNNSYDGIYYDGFNINPYNGKHIKLDKLDNLDNLTWCARNKYIGKISFNR